METETNNYYAVLENINKSDEEKTTKTQTEKTYNPNTNYPNQYLHIYENHDLLKMR